MFQVKARESSEFPVMMVTPRERRVTVAVADVTPWLITRRKRIKPMRAEPPAGLTLSVTYAISRWQPISSLSR